MSGYLSGPRPLLLLALMMVTSAPRSARGQDRSCGKDADCVLVTRSFSPCRCAPCGGRAVSRPALQKWKRKASRLRCRRLPRCRRCKAWAPGSREAACVKGRCQVRAVVRAMVALRGNVKTRFFHASTCRHFRCKNCTATFATRVAARQAGYHPHKQCAAGAIGLGIQPRKKDDSSCKRNADCGFLPSVCPICAPCKPTWRPVGNREAIRRIRGIQAIVDCARPRCKPCASSSNWLGKKAICLKGRCVPR